MISYELVIRMLMNSESKLVLGIYFIIEKATHNNVFICVPDNIRIYTKNSIILCICTLQSHKHQIDQINVDNFSVHTLVV